MKPAPFDYVRPSTVDEALGLLAAHRSAARILAGGQSLVPLLNAREARPDVVIDINGLPGLDRVDAFADHVVVGALVRQSAAASSPGFEDLRLLARAAACVGHVQTRNRGTVCGSLAYADPVAEIPLALLVSGGSVDVRSASGSRSIAMDAWLASAMAPSIADDELVVGCRCRVPAAGSGVGFLELAAGVNVCAAAALIEPSTQDRWEVRVGVTGPVDRPRVLARSMDALDVETGSDVPAFHEVAAALVEPWDFIDDVSADGEYRQAAARELAVRALVAARTDMDFAPGERR